MFNFKSLIVLAAAVIVVGHGAAPVSNSAAQAKMMARRAAIVDVYRQTNGAPMHILSQIYEDGVFTVTAEIQ